MQSRLRCPSESWSGLLLSLALLGAFHAKTAAQEAPGSGSATRTAARKLQLELARSEEAYLELDSEAQVLRLKLGAAVLRHYPLQSAELGLPKLALIPLRRPRHWALRLWSGGRLEPGRPENRLEVRPAPGDSLTDTLAQLVKLLLESSKLPPAPWDYRIRYDGGFALAVTCAPDTAGGAPLSAKLRNKWQEFIDVVTKPKGVLRLRLARDDAQHLYRVLPAESKLLVLTKSAPVPTRKLPPAPPRPRPRLDAEDTAPKLVPESLPETLRGSSGLPESLPASVTGPARAAVSDSAWSAPRDSLR